MEVIARKKTGVGIMYLVCTFFGLTIFGMGISDEIIIVGLLGLVLSIISGYIFFDYVSLPYDVIKVDTEGNLHLPKSIVIPLRDITDISYRRASAKGIQYKWGSVTMRTHLEKFKYGYIRNCEDVAKQLTEMMHRAKFENPKKN